MPENFEIKIESKNIEEEERVEEAESVNQTEAPRIVEVNEKKEKEELNKAKADLKGAFETGEKDEKIKSLTDLVVEDEMGNFGRDREKTKEELEIINLANDATNRLLNVLGLENRDVPSEKVHIFEDNLIGKIYKAIKKKIFGDEKKGSNHHFAGVIAVNNPKSNVQFAATVIHEMLHEKSFNATEKGENNSLNTRTGFSSRSLSSGTERFVSLNEAVVEELTKLAMSGIVKDNIFKGESEKKDTYFYRKECEDLRRVIKKIFENSGDYKSEAEVFSVFAISLFTGDISKTEEMVDKTFGKGAFQSKFSGSQARY